MKIRKHFEYARYLARHKWFVLVAGIELGVPFRRLLIHDGSKFLPSEWFAYVNRFYDDTTFEEFVDAGRKFGVAECAPNPFFTMDFFELAWMRHQKRNKHHWEYWTRIVRKSDAGYASAIAMPIPETYVREMVADWAAAGRAINGKWDVRSWFDANENKILIHSDAMALVEQLIDQIDRSKEAPGS